MSSGPSPFWWLRWVPLALAAVALAGLVYWLGRVAILPLLVSCAVAYVLYPLTDYIERRTRISRVGSALLSIAGIGVLLTLFALFVIPDLWAQGLSAFSKLSHKFSPENATRARQSIREFSPLADRLFGARVEQVWRNPSSMTGGSYSWIAGVATGFLSTAAASLDLLVTPLFIFYLLLDFRRWRDSAEELIPARFRDTCSLWLDETGGLLQSYVLGQILIALLMALLYALGFALLGVPAWACIATVAGLLNVIPYVGTTSGILLATGFTYAEYGDWWRVAGVLGWFAIVQTIEGYLLTPRILGGRLSLHPMAVLLGLLIGGKIFGLLGIVLAAPTMAVAQAALRTGRELYLQSSFYLGREPGLRLHRPLVAVRSPDRVEPL